MIISRLIKIALYSLLIMGVIICLVQLFRWEIYPYIQILSGFLISIISLLVSELIKTRKEEIRLVILVGTICQLIASLIILTSASLVQEYWRIVFFPSLFIVLVSTYAISLRKEEKHHTLFKLLTMAILTMAATRFIFYHVFIDYTIEILYLMYIIFIFRAQNKKPESLAIPL